MTIHRGGCHCGKVRFEIEAPEDLEVLECNCSICQKLGYMHLMVPRAQFRLVSGKDSLISYQFNTRAANHLFCRVCGVKSFYMPRSHPNDFSINARCLDDGTVQMMTVTPFDGQNWEEAAAELEPLS